MGKRRIPRDNRCFILKLTIQLLSETLSYLLPYKQIEVTRWTKKVSDSLFRSGRAVCRQFRVLVAQLPFWYLPDFDVLRLKSQFVKDVDFLHNLCTDRDITNTLQRRTDWPELMNIAALELVRNSVALFRENAKSVHLELVDRYTTSMLQSRPRFDIAMNHLKSCPCLSSLSLKHGYEAINLDALTEEFPSLEILELPGSTKNIYGTLGLQNLREMGHVDVEVSIYLEFS